MEFSSAGECRNPAVFSPARGEGLRPAVAGGAGCAAAMRFAPYVATRAPPPLPYRSGSDDVPVLAVGIAASEWPVPCDARSSGARLGRRGAQKLVMVDAEQDEATSDWPRPAVAPEGPPSTVLADRQRLLNMLEAEDEEHRARLRQMRREFVASQEAERWRIDVEGEEVPQTEVEWRRLLSRRARRRREAEEERMRIEAGVRRREARHEAEAAEAAWLAEQEAAAEEAREREREAMAAAETEAHEAELTAWAEWTAQMEAEANAAAEAEARAEAESEAAAAAEVEARARMKAAAAAEAEAAEVAAAAAAAAAKAKAEAEAAKAAAEVEAKARVEAEAKARAEAEAKARAEAEAKARAEAEAKARAEATATAMADDDAKKKKAGAKMDAKADAKAEAVAIAAAAQATAAGVTATSFESTVDFGSSGAGSALAIEPSQITLGRSIAPGAFAEVFRGMLWGQKVGGDTPALATLPAAH